MSVPFLWDGKMTILALQMETHQPESSRGQVWCRFQFSREKSSISRPNFTHLHPKNFTVQIPIKGVSILGQCSRWPKSSGSVFFSKKIKNSVQNFCFFGKAGKCKVDDETWMPTHQERVGTDVGRIVYTVRQSLEYQVSMTFYSTGSGRQWLNLIPKRIISNQAKISILRFVFSTKKERGSQQIYFEGEWVEYWSTTHNMWGPTQASRCFCWSWNLELSHFRSRSWFGLFYGW